METERATVDPNAGVARAHIEVAQRKVQGLLHDAVWMRGVVQGIALAASIGQKSGPAGIVDLELRVARIHDAATYLASYFNLHSQGLLAQVPGVPEGHKEKEF